MRKDPPKKKQWWQESGTMKEKLARHGTTKNGPQRKSNASGVGDMLEVPQKQATKMVTGRYETPGQALERKGIIKNKTALDAIDFVSDPINAIPLIKGAKAMKVGTRKALSKTAKAVNKVTKTVKTTDNISDIKNSRTAK